MKLTQALAGMAILLFPAAPLAAEGGTGWTVDETASIFAVVTHKAGLAARLAHNHLVEATGYEARLTFDPAAPENTTFELEAPAAKLRIDHTEAQNRWYPRLAELGILDQVFAEISDKDRKKIRQAMVGKNQLDVDRHAALGARVSSVKAGTDREFPFTVELAFTVVGKTVTKPVKARFELRGERLMLEAFGELKFTDFGIEPYSAMLGAVRNDDPFHLYLYLEADPAATATAKR